MAFSSIEALQAFGLGEQAAERRRMLDRQDAELARKDKLRTDLGAAYNTETGQLDRPAVRGAYAAAGDIEGAMDFDKAQAALDQSMTKQHQEQLRIGAQLLSNVQDESSYQQARSAAQAAGLDLNDIPMNYDPTYVENVRQIGSVLDRISRPAEKPYRFRNNSGDLLELGPDGQARTLYDDPEEKINWVRADKGDGTFTMVPVGRNGPVAAPQASPAASPNSSPPAQAIEYLRANPQLKAQFDAKYGSGAADRVLGGAGPSGPQTFP